MAGVLLQVVSLPLAAFHLGPAGFSIYAMFGAIMAAMMLSNVGLSNATTLHVSRALAAGDSTADIRLLSVSLVLVASLVTLVLLFIIPLILFTPALELAFARHLDDTAAPLPAAIFLCFVFATSQLLSVVEAVQLAQQRQHRLNIASSIGTLIAAISVWVVATTAPTLIGILTAVHLPVLTARFLNAVLVLRELRINLSELRVGNAHWQKLLGDGLRFVSGPPIANLLCHALSIFTVGLYFGPLPAASFAAVMNGVLLIAAISGYAVSPLRGSLPEAYERGDYVWVTNSYRYAIRAAAAFTAVPLCALIGFGPSIFDFWYAGSVAPSHITTAFAGIYILMASFEVVYFVFLSGLGHLRFASNWILTKGIVSISLVFVASYANQLDLVFVILVIVNALFSFLPLRTRLLTVLRSETTQP